MKLTLKRCKPRNPIAFAATGRAAGSHRPANGARRQWEQHEFRAAIRAEADGWRKPT